METSKTTKKRLPQNKNLLSLNFQGRPEIQGSDSGISIQSREGTNRSFSIYFLICFAYYRCEVQVYFGNKRLTVSSTIPAGLF